MKVSIYSAAPSAARWDRQITQNPSVSSSPPAKYLQNDSHYLDSQPFKLLLAYMLRIQYMSL